MTPFCTELTGITEETLASAGDRLVGLKRVGFGTELGVGDGFIFFQENVEVEGGHDSWKEPFSTKPVGGTVNWLNFIFFMLP